VEFCEWLESDVRSSRILTSPASNIGSATVASPSSTSASSVQNPEGVEPDTLEGRRLVVDVDRCQSLAAAMTSTPAQLMALVLSDD